ncbi:FAD/FMN-containing dehydrogenase/Fe-S oxidoreductase [Salinibacter ruber]|uniref:FAD-binding and (Fe-S)-binding domain-containing protein n=1 Tax=Salinibacter ruber TaxID=146919 RepID=UPI002168672D|nr:FAD-binding and (Fe-S)-binding domain-containing protein [Salinibacter ruber]MCS4114013.1 FAD/FMN-containing dehydrogenase/Fe-S oxidoreductase [Salinibacter ruber]
MPAPSAPSPQTASLTETLRPRISGTIHTDEMTRALYATDASMYAMSPVAVLVPETKADVQTALTVAHEQGVPVLPRGGGSSLAGQGVNEALVVDFTNHLNRIHEIDPEAQTARVEPGVTLAELNRAAAEHGLMVGPDPASANRATLGGMLANNSTGTHSIAYGNFIHHVREAEVLLADGTATTVGPTDPATWQDKMRDDGLEGAIYRGLKALLADGGRETIREDTPSHWRRNNGYRLEALLDEAPNLAKLLCGSEGTLAVTTELTCDLVEKPATTGLGVVHFESRDDALRAVTTVLDTDPSAVELFDGVAIERTLQTPGYAERLTFLEGTPGSVLITEYAGDTDAEVDAALDALEQTMAEASRGYATVRVTEPDAIKNVWSIRKEGLGLLMGVEGDYKPWAFIEDASVPVENLADYIDELSTFVDATDTRAAYYAHASAGCLHVRPFVNTKDETEVEKMTDIAKESLDLVTKYGGVVSSEHGDGIARGWANPHILGEDLYELCRETKALFDPEGILNPGKVVDAPPMDENLRMGPTYETEPFRTELDFSEDGGFTGAIEKCNGNGACRKLRAGTMCPSFMATREEPDSTRGRANALRSALAGDLSEDAMTGDDMHEVMDLCVQCKACKTECPSNVDMAKIKTEWLHHYWDDNGVPLRTRLFARQPDAARWISGTPLASLVNWASGQSALRQVGEALLGVSAERPLPPFARETFRQWFQNQQPPVGGDGARGPRVVLFPDAFNAYHTPAPLRAATRVLQATGHRVELPPAAVGSARTLLSKGLVPQAKRRARQTVDALHAYAEAGVPVVGLEPSSILTLRDEFLDLLPNDARTEAVADAAYTFAEYLAERAEDGALDRASWRGSGDVLLHGHCHQKALIGTTATEQALSRAGYDVTAVDAGCCGMAGAFGYEAEHVDVSKQMAELRLAPAVRQTDADTRVAAPGFSCRSQIKDVTTRTAQHPAELLWDAIEHDRSPEAARSSRPAR